VCTAHHELREGKSVWVMRPFNIPILPANDRIFTASSKTLSWLREQHFDFNHWVDKGVPYIRRQDSQDDEEYVTKLREQIQELKEVQGGAESKAKEGRSKVPLTKPVDKDYAQSILDRVAAWQGDAQGESILKLQENNGWRRLIIHQEVGERYPQFHLQSEKIPGASFIYVHRGLDTAVEHLERKLSSKVSELEHKVGARKVVDALCASRVPVVGHNCFFDLLHLHQAFVASLDEHVEDWKASHLKEFPFTFDTKWIAEEAEAMREAPCDSTTLRPMCEQLVEKSQELQSFELAEGFSERYTLIGDERLAEEGDKTDRSHEAGFDALMTAQAFAVLLSRVSAHGGHTISDKLVGDTGELLPHLAAHCNCLKLMATVPPAFSLESPESHDFSKHFRVDGIAKTWRQSDVLKELAVEGFVSFVKAPQPSGGSVCWLTVASEAAAEKMAAYVTPQEETSAARLTVVSYASFVAARDSSLKRHQDSTLTSPKGGTKRPHDSEGNSEHCQKKHKPE